MAAAEAQMDPTLPPPRGDRARDEDAWRRGPAAHLCHQKSSSLPGTACLEQLLEPPPPPAEPALSPGEPRTPDKGEELGSTRHFLTSAEERIPQSSKDLYAQLAYHSEWGEGRNEVGTRNWERTH
ncbi:hypothetical protein CB1_011054017 [Camelus ferus]|nr:hypothetical protein CB1_011054017 [Camelus ferus]